MNIIKISFAGVAIATVSACSIEGTGKFGGPDDYIAVAADVGQRRGGANLNNNSADNAGIAVTPDGCQAWIIDDGIEGRASNRLDPISGLPVCGGEPGVVYGDYNSGNTELQDRVPRRPTNIVIENVEVRNTEGHAHVVHDPSVAHH